MSKLLPPSAREANSQPATKKPNKKSVPKARVSKTRSTTDNESASRLPQPRQEQIVKTAEPTMSRATRGKLQRRRVILAAARKLFATHGYNGTTPQDIVREADVAYGTFYDNFASKQECFAAFAQEIDYEVNQALRWHLPPASSIPRRPQEFLYALLKATFDYSVANPGVLKAILSEDAVLIDGHHDDGTIIYGATGWINRLDKWRQIGYASEDYNITYLGDMMAGMIRLGDALIAKHPKNADEIVENITRFMVRALGPKEGD